MIVHSCSVRIWNLATIRNHSVNGESIEGRGVRACRKICHDVGWRWGGGEGETKSRVRELALLKACAKEKNLCEGSRVHIDIIKKGLLEKNDQYLGNTLVSLYAKCGVLSRAEHVFDRLLVRNVVSWNALIAGYAEHERCWKQALLCFQRMRCLGVSPNAVTYVCILKACGRNNMIMGRTSVGEEIYNAIVEDGFLETNILVGNTLVDMYAKCGELVKARKVFEQLPCRNVISWNALISGYVQSGNCEEALKCFEQMQVDGICPDEVTYICGLQACGSVGAFDKGEEIHAQVIRAGMIERDILVGTTLVDMYAKCDALAKAQEVFDQLQVRNVVSWSALIAGYAQHGHGEEALNCVTLMRREAVSPNAVTFVSILKACGMVGAVDKGKELHAEILREGLLKKNILVGNALIGMYAKCSLPLRAHDVFDSLPDHNVISWTSLIAGYAQYGHGHEAMNCFQQMQNEGFLPNAVTFVILLKICGCAGAGTRGKEIHSMLARNDLLTDNVLLGNVLVDMYAKCGLLGRAQAVFDQLHAHDAFSWNALINGYAQLGNDDVVINLTNKMIAEGIQPDVVTFTLILNACSHGGFLDKGKICFEMMSSSFGIIPTSEHHTCMVDLFRRADNLDKAIAIIEMMPAFDFPLIWTALLSACQKRGDIEVGAVAFKHAVQLNEKHTAAYVCMKNMYSADI